MFVLHYLFLICFLFGSCLSSSMEIVTLTDPVQHAEGPFYHDQTNFLYYVDTFKATAYRYNFKTQERTSYKLKDRNSIAVIIPMTGTDDEFLVGADRCLFKLIWPDCVEEQETLEELLTIEQTKPTNQFNDGKVDSEGRLWIGSLTRNQDLSVSSKGGSLYMFKGEDLGNFEEKIRNTSISNGLAWSSDNKYFYFVDTELGKVFGYDYDAESGKIDGQKVVFDVKNHTELKGLPDGMTIDTSDNLWIALFGGHSVIHVDPRTSTILRVVELPATYVTSACFGGSNLDVLFVTTSRLHLNETQIQEEPLAGGVFAIKNLGVKGLPANTFHYKIK